MAIGIGLGQRLKQTVMPYNELQILTGTSTQVKAAIETILKQNTMLEDDNMDNKMISSIDSIADGNDNYLEDEIYGYKSQADGGNGTDFFDRPPADRRSLEEELREQLELSTITKDTVVYKVVLSMISDLDANGFLTNMEIQNQKSFDEKKYANTFFFRENVSPKIEEIRSARNIVKQLGERVGLVGLGSASTKECLLEQLKSTKGPINFTAKLIIREHFEALSTGTEFLDKIRTSHPTCLEYFPEAMSLIERLNPSPGNRDSSKILQTQQREATFVVSVFDEYVETLESPQRNLKFNPDSLTILQQYEKKYAGGGLSKNQHEAYTFMRNDYKEAIKTIRLLNARSKMQEVVLNTIIENQKAFLLTNDLSKLKALKMTDFTGQVIERMRESLHKEDFNVSESTVRNYLRGNSLQSNHGLYKLVDLVPSESRLNIMRTRFVVADIIKEEAGFNPLKDSDVANMVKIQTGIPIRSKHVTAIREELRIASPVVRKARAMTMDYLPINRSQSSSNALHTGLLNILEKEDKKAPMKDSTIAKLLSETHGMLDSDKVREMREELHIGDSLSRLVKYNRKLNQTSIPGVSDIASVSPAGNEFKHGNSL